METLVLVCGKRGSGKSYLANKVSTERGFKHYEMSFEAKQLRKDDEMDYLRLRKYVSIKIRHEGPGFLMTNLINQKGFSLVQKSIVSGIRHIEEYEIAKLTCPNTILIYMQRNFFARLLKTLKRGSRNSLLEFIIEEYYSIKWGNRKLKGSAVIIKNEGGQRAFSELCKILDLHRTNRQHNQ